MTLSPHNIFHSVKTNMSSESELWKRSLFGSEDSHGHCCPPVFDPYTLVALLAGIALATFFLRLVIINQVFNGRRSLGSFNIYGEQTMRLFRFDTVLL